MRFLVMTSVVLVSLVCSVFGASPFNSYKSAESSLLSNFGSGRVIKASSASSSATWILYNEGHLGYSYSSLGDMILNSADVGYSSYIVSVSSAGGLHPYVGVEITVPVYLRARGDSNIFATSPQNQLPNGTKLLGETNFSGWGVQIPAVLGVHFGGGFYIQAMAGYSYHSLTDTFFKSATENNWSANAVYQGVVYGGGLGLKLKDTFSIGVRYMMGNLNSTTRDPGDFTALNAFIKTKDFQVPYWRASIILGYVF